MAQLSGAEAAEGDGLITKLLVSVTAEWIAVAAGGLGGIGLQLVGEARVAKLAVQKK